LLDFGRPALTGAPDARQVRDRQAQGLNLADLTEQLKAHEGLAAMYGEAMAGIETADTPDELEEVRVKHLGRKSGLSVLLRSIPELSPEERPVVGRLGNQVRAALEQALADKKKSIEGGELIRRLATALPKAPKWRQTITISRRSTRPKGTPPVPPMTPFLLTGSPTYF
jgi:hypothetical protein